MICRSRPGFCQVLAHPRRGAVAQRNDAVLFAFALADRDGGAFEIEIPELQVHQFEPPHPGGVERLEDGAIAQSEGIVDVGLLEDLLGFSGRQHGFRQPDSQPRQLQFARRIVQDVVCRAIHLNHIRNGTMRSCWLVKLRARRSSCGWNTCGDTFEHRARHFHGLGDSALVAPAEEKADVHALDFHGVLGVVLAAGLPMLLKKASSAVTLTYDARHCASRICVFA